MVIHYALIEWVVITIPVYNMRPFVDEFILRDKQEYGAGLMCDCMYA